MEEFIFDDDVDEVGADVEAHCPKCRADTTHVVISKYEDEIRKVQCNACSDVHAYRKPRGEDDPEEGPQVKAKKQKAKPTYDQAIAKWKKTPRTYVIGEFFKELDVLTHPKFGVGYVTENIGEDKIEVTFKDDKRVLIHNRKNLNLPIVFAVADEAPVKAAKGKAAAAKVTAKAEPAKAAKPVAKAPAKEEVKAKAEPVKAAKSVKAEPVKAAKPAAKAAKPTAKPVLKAAVAKAAPKAATKATIAPKAPKGKLSGAARPAAKKPARPTAKKPVAKPVAKASKAASKPLKKSASAPKPVKASARAAAKKPTAKKPAAKPAAKAAKKSR